MRTANGYTYRWDGHRLIIQDVPIFAVCQRAPDGETKFDGNFNEQWVIQAARNVMRRQNGDHYYPPLHLKHHAKSIAGDPAQRAGHFEIKSTGRIQFEGRPRMAIFADLVVTDEAAQEAVLKSKFPYRSIEIIDIDGPPTIDSLALLDTEVPFLKLPNITPSSIEGVQGVSSGVSGETFAADWSLNHYGSEEPVVASWRRDRHAALLFQEFPTMTTKHKDDFGAGIRFEDDKDKEAPKGDDTADEKMEGEGESPDIAGLLSLVKSGKIAFKDMMALSDALNAAMSSVNGGTEEKEPEPAPAANPGPGVEAMSAQKSSDPTVQHLLDEIARLGAAQVKMAAETQKVSFAATRDRAIHDAEARLGQMVGDVRTTLEEWYDRPYGPQTFSAFVDQLATSNPPRRELDPSGAETAGSTSDLALSFADMGKEAVKFAAESEAQFDSCKGQMDIRCPREDWVRMDMENWAAREGVQFKQQTN